MNFSSYLSAKIFLALMTFICMVGCDKNDNETTFGPNVVLLSSSKVVSSGESSQRIEGLSNEAWTVSTDVEWISIVEKKGTKGKVDISYSVSENEGDERVGVITVSTESGTMAEFVVTQEAGEIMDDAELFVKEGGTGKGYSWADATSLENALEIAVSGNVIHIAEGTYLPTKTITGGDSSDDSDKTFEIKHNLTLVGGYPADATEDTEPDHSKYKTILSGDEKYYHVVTVSAPLSDSGEKVILQGLTISRSKETDRNLKTSVAIDGNNYPRNHGGGIIVGPSQLEIINCEITENKAGLSSAIYMNYGADIKVNRTKISKNTAEHHCGGVWVRNGSKLTIIDSEITNNTSVGVGTALYIFEGSEANIYNTLIADNKGDNHGVGVYVRNSSKANIVNGIIVDNSSPKGSGAGIMMYDNNEITLVNTTITGNSSGTGGGLFGRNGINKVTVNNSIISGNEQLEGPEVDSFKEGELTVSYFGSIIGAATYNEKGENIPDATIFDAEKMFENSGDWIFKLKGENNPAFIHGLTVENLIQIGINMDPAVKEEIVAHDFFHNSRHNVSIMGAIVK